MKSKIALCVVATVALIIGGCGGGSSSSGSGSSTEADAMTGAFSGDWNSSSTNSGMIDVNFTRSANTVTGRVTRHTISACTLSNFSGTATSDTMVSGTFSGGGNVVTWTGTLSGNSFAGPYRVTQGGCKGDIGTIAMGRL